MLDDVKDANIHAICIYALLLFFSLSILIALSIQFRVHSSNQYQRNTTPAYLRWTAYTFLISCSLSWIILLVLEIYMVHEPTTIAVHESIYFPVPFAAFNVFALVRLKLTFEFSVYQISNMYFGCVAALYFASFCVRTYDNITSTYYLEYSNLFIGRHFLAQHGFPNVMEAQFCVLDALVRLSICVQFNRRLFALIVAQRERLSEYRHSLSTRVRSIGSNLNERQSVLVHSVAKHTILISSMVVGNLVWVLWMHLIEFDAIAETTASTVAGKYIVFVENVVQIMCLYLGFPFAINLYSKCCSKIHKSCESCCVRIALQKVTMDVEKEYELMSVDGSFSNR